jgi:DNA-binding MarR family transcriptional regulator
MTDKNEDIYEAWGAFFVTHALAVKQIEERLAGHVPLSLDEYDVLLAIDRSMIGRVRFSELADRAVCTRSGITRMIKRLEDRGFIGRVSCEHDRRGVFAVLTGEGKSAMKDTWRRYSKEIGELFGAAFTASEARELKGLMEKVLKVIQGPELIKIAGRKRS